MRGDQVSGEYLGLGSALDAEGWFPTRDRAYLDDDGYLFVEGRADDTIIRGGENIAPAEIEDVLIEHPAVRAVAVVGLPDEEWGERIGGGGARPGPRPRSSRRSSANGCAAPGPRTTWSSGDDLPYTDTGKVQRHRLVRSCSPGSKSSGDACGAE